MSEDFVIGVDASAIVGGGLTHLRGVFAHGDPTHYGIRRFRVWARRSLLDQLPERDWLEGVSPTWVEGPRWQRMLWQRIGLPRALRDCDLFWVPGGFVPFHFSPLVSMAQNSLLYDRVERQRFGLTPFRLRLELLRASQLRSIRRAEGVIFLTEWGERLVRDSVEVLRDTCVVPHGIDARFLREPRPQRPLSAYSDARPLRLLYVSIIDLYKHQWHVAQAVAALRRDGMPVEIVFAGPAYAPALRRFETELDALDPDRRFLRYLGPVPYAELPELYARADLAVFASTCENLPNILLEAMGSGLPVACSDRSPMRDVLRDGGAYFDPESPTSIEAALRVLIGDPDLRARLAARARAIASEYTWERCADDTFRFLAAVARKHARKGFVGRQA